MNYRLSFVVTIQLLLGSSTNPAFGEGAVETAIDVAMEDAIGRYNIRGASIAYYDGNTMEAPLVRGYGQLSSAADSDAVDGSTVFMIASVSKVFTGVAVSALLDSGTIELDDDICDTLAGLDFATSACRNPHAADAKVTWRMLVTHRSSMAGSLPFAKNANGDTVEAAYAPVGAYEGGIAVGNPSCPLEDTLSFYRDYLTNTQTTTVGGDVDWYALAQNDGGAWKKEAPGDASEYSNAAFGYLAPLIALEAGMTFPNFSKERIFDKLGMKNTAWFRRDLPQTGVAEAIPNLYSAKTDAFTDLPGPDGGHYCFVDYASGSLHTSAEDLAKFGKAMLDYGVGTLFEKESTGKAATECQERDSAGAEVSECEYGVAWNRLYNGMPYSPASLCNLKDADWTDGVSHNGGEAGSQTLLFVLPKAKTFAVVLTSTSGNSEEASDMLMNDLLAAANGGAKEGCTYSGSGSGSGPGPGEKDSAVVNNSATSPAGTFSMVSTCIIVGAVYGMFL